MLDLGSGGGIDVLLSARRVGPTGFAYGLDMTDEMLALAEPNKATSRRRPTSPSSRARSRRSRCRTDSVDVVISNCVINLAADKGAGPARGLSACCKPGGRFAVSDVVAQGALPAELRADMEAWVGCVAGALEIETYRRLLGEAGFGEIDVEVTRRYSVAEYDIDATRLPVGWEAADGRLASAFVRAAKPLATTRLPLTVAAAEKPDDACCGPDCCS